MGTHGIADRVSDLGDRTRERLVQSRMDKLDRENDRLRTEVSVLRDDLGEERGALKEALKGLEARENSANESRRPHFIRAVVIAGTAYVLGTRDGRERYEQIVKKARSLSERVKSRMSDRSGNTWESPERDDPATKLPASGSS